MRKISILFVLATTLLCGCRAETVETHDVVAKEKPATSVKYYYEEPSSYEAPDSDGYKYYDDDSYDDGYNDIYEEDDYDLDRYWEDDDYASGVDDAIEEYYEEYGEYWE